MKVTISDIARTVGCSVSAVSKALSGAADINVGTREQILKAAVEMGYNIGRKKAKSAGTLAAVVQCSTLDSESFEYNMLFGFQLEATQSGYDVEIVRVNPGDPSWDFRKQVVEKGFDGAFLLRIGSSYNIASEVESGALPIVAFDQTFDSPKAAYIGCDNSEGIRLAVRHLKDLGHKNIAYFGGTPTAFVSVERKKSFIASMRGFGLEPRAELITESNFSQNFASSAVPGFLENGATAVVCASDLLATYIIDEVKKYGIRVPEDLSVVGYDNVPLGEEFVPKLTTVDQNIAEIGKNAFFVLRKLMAGVSIGRILFRPSLVVRESTAPPKKKI